MGTLQAQPSSSLPAMLVVPSQTILPLGTSAEGGPCLTLGNAEQVPAVVPYSAVLALVAVTFLPLQRCLEALYFSNNGISAAAGEAIVRAATQGVRSHPRALHFHNNMTGAYLPCSSNTYGPSAHLRVLCGLSHTVSYLERSVLRRTGCTSTVPAWLTVASLCLCCCWQAMRGLRHWQSWWVPQPRQGWRTSASLRRALAPDGGTALAKALARGRVPPCSHLMPQSQTQRPGTVCFFIGICSGLAQPTLTGCAVVRWVWCAGSKLRKVDLRDNMLGEEGAEALVETLAKHPDLEEIYLGDTSETPALDLPLPSLCTVASPVYEQKVFCCATDWKVMFSCDEALVCCVVVGCTDRPRQ